MEITDAYDRADLIQRLKKDDVLGPMIIEAERHAKFLKRLEDLVDVGFQRQARCLGLTHDAYHNYIYRRQQEAAEKIAIDFLIEPK